MADPKERDELIARLQRELALARFYLDRFADPTSFVWKMAERPPHEFARDALSDMDAERGRPDPGELHFEVEFPVGTGRIPRLAGGRAGFVEFHQMLARQALEIGQVGAARAALRVLRVSDFAQNAPLAEALLAVLRDSRSSEEELAEAAQRIAHLPATPEGGSP
jgi:hypothetical protein